MVSRLQTFYHQSKWHRPWNCTVSAIYHMYMLVKSLTIRILLKSTKWAAINAKFPKSSRRSWSFTWFAIYDELLVPLRCSRKWHFRFSQNFVFNVWFHSEGWEFPLLLNLQIWMDDGPGRTSFDFAVCWIYTQSVKIIVHRLPLVFLIFNVLVSFIPWGTSYYLADQFSVSS